MDYKGVQVVSEVGGFAVFLAPESLDVYIMNNLVVLSRAGF